MAGLSIRGARKSYGDAEVIHGVDLEVGDGEFIVLVGPSGCGKSTLLRMIAGLERITAGEIAIGERVVNELEPKDRDIAMVFQNYALYPHMSVFDNMAYGLRIRGMKKPAIAERVAHAAEILELAELLDRKPRQLSGGQRQRVAMGRAIVREPQVFLFDEPLSNLDAKLRVQMRLEIKKLHRRLGVTSIYVTHDQVEAMTLADRLMVMNAGIAEQIGTPLEVYQRPATTFVAGFIGSPAMNFLNGRIGERGEVLVDGGPPLLLAAEGVGQAGRTVVVGIRPEDLELAPEGTPSLDLRVDVVEPLGADTLVHGTVPNLSQAVTVRLSGNRPFPLGERLPLGVAGGRVHLFAADSGARLN